MTRNEKPLRWTKLTHQFNSWWWWWDINKSPWFSSGNCCLRLLFLYLKFIFEWKRRSCSVSVAVKIRKTGPDSLPWCQCTCKTKKSFGVNVLMTLFRTVGLSMSSHSVVPVISVACWSTVCVLICMHVCMYVCMYVRSTVCIYSMYFVVNQLWDKFFFFLIWIVQFHLVFF